MFRVAERDDSIVECTLGGASPFKFKIDSGADVNVLSEEDWSRLSGYCTKGEAFIYDVCETPTKTLTAFAAVEPLKLSCSFTAWIEVNGTCKPEACAKFYVVKEDVRLS